eukprot:2179490-Karenia_brevis.AAC.1
MIDQHGLVHYCPQRNAPGQLAIERACRWNKNQHGCQRLFPLFFVEVGFLRQVGKMHKSAKEYD